MPTLISFIRYQIILLAIICLVHCLTETGSCFSTPEGIRSCDAHQCNNYLITNSSSVILWAAKIVCRLSKLLDFARPSFGPTLTLSTQRKGVDGWSHDYNLHCMGLRLLSILSADPVRISSVAIVIMILWFHGTLHNQQPHPPMLLLSSPSTFGSELRKQNCEKSLWGACLPVTITCSLQLFYLQLFMAWGFKNKAAQSVTTI